MKRLTKDEYFLSLAKNITASRAICDRLWIGCVIVVVGEIAAIGYNVAAPGLYECGAVGHLLICSEDGSDYYKRVIHGKKNVLY